MALDDRADVLVRKADPITVCWPHQTCTVDAAAIHARQEQVDRVVRRQTVRRTFHERAVSRVAHHVAGHGMDVDVDDHDVTASYRATPAPALREPGRVFDSPRAG